MDVSRVPAVVDQPARHRFGSAGPRSGPWHERVSTLRESTQMPGGTHTLATVLGVVETLDGAAPPDEITDARSSALIRTGKLVGRSLAAQVRLAASAPQAAIADLDLATVWRRDDVRGAARLAEAWLAVEDGSFAKRLGVAALA